MVILKSPNRFLTKVEIEYDLKSLNYNDSVLTQVLKKHGFSSDYVWKKNSMERFRTQIEKERKSLDDLVSVYVEKQREDYKNKLKTQEFKKHLFVLRERYFHLELKVQRLRSLIELLEEQGERALEALDKNVTNRKSEIFLF